MNKNKVADERQQKKIINNLNSATSSSGKKWIENLENHSMIL